jgi:hypothetical protein
VTIDLGNPIPRAPGWPDYDTARSDFGFTWSVDTSYASIMEAVGINIREFFLDVDVCIDAYRRGRKVVREMYGDRVNIPAPATPPISYGHVNTLGAQLVFPEGGEVGHIHPFTALEDAIAALRVPVDFASAGMAPFYLDFHRKMKEAFPEEERIGFSFGSEGPLTTCWELLGEQFFVDLMERPDDAKAFLELVTDSIIDYRRFQCDVMGDPRMGEAAGMADDLASMIPPRIFAQMVLPYWDRLYRAVTDGKWHIHVEGLSPEHLPLLEEAGLSFFDPTISPRLNPGIISQRCRVPFLWVLADIYHPRMDCKDVEDFVYQSAADGASSVAFHVHNLVFEDQPAKSDAFIKAADRVKQMLDAGASRAEIGTLVSAEGRRKFWDGWPV